MSTLNTTAYKNLIKENMLWLHEQKHSLERMHILSILEYELKHLPVYSHLNHQYKQQTKERDCE